MDILNTDAQFSNSWCENQGPEQLGGDLAEAMKI